MWNRYSQSREATIRRDRGGGLCQTRAKCLFVFQWRRIKRWRKRSRFCPIRPHPWGGQSCNRFPVFFLRTSFSRKDSFFDFVVVVRVRVNLLRFTYCLIHLLIGLSICLFIYLFHAFVFFFRSLLVCLHHQHFPITRNCEFSWIQSRTA